MGGYFCRNYEYGAIHAIITPRQFFEVGDAGEIWWMGRYRVATKIMSRPPALLRDYGQFFAVVQSTESSVVALGDLRGRMEFDE